MKYIIFFLLLSLSAAGQQEFFHAQNKGLLLDEYPNAAAAYSLRRVNSRYTGALIRVRRDSTGQAEQDIGSIGEALDTVALKAFVRNNSGYVTTWYDQSGNARNATQTTAASQPRIVNAGVVDRENGKPALNFNTTTDGLIYNASLFLGASQRSIIVVYKLNATPVNTTFSIFGQNLASSTSTGGWSMIQARTTTGATGDPYFAGFGADLGNGLTTANTDQKLASFYYNGTTGYLIKNSTQITSGNITLNALSNQSITIGSLTQLLLENSNAKIQEGIIYTSNQLANRTQIEQNINSYYAIY
jgi:hypothetical protein